MWSPQQYARFGDERSRPFFELVGRIGAYDAQTVVDLGFTSDRVHFEAGDIATWAPDHPVDVLISNAALQWDLDHLARLPALLDHIRPGGWLAFQVPGNLDDPHHHAIRALRHREPWAAIPALAAIPAHRAICAPDESQSARPRRLPCRTPRHRSAHADERALENAQVSGRARPRRATPTPSACDTHRIRIEGDRLYPKGAAALDGDARP